MNKIDPSPQMSITGIVTARATGKPVPKITVMVMAPGLPGSPELGKAVTDKKGSYKVEIESETLESLDLKRDEPVPIKLKLDDAKGRTIFTTEQAMLLRYGTDIRVDVAAPKLEHGLDWPHMAYIAGQPVNLTAAAQLTADDLIQAYLFLRGHVKELKHRILVSRALPGLFDRRDPDDDCGEGRLDVIRALLSERGQEKDLDEIDADDFPTGTTVQWFYTPLIRVKYTTDIGSIHRVNPTLPSADAAVQLSDGTTIGWVRQNLVDIQAFDPANTEVAPTYVQQVGIIAHHALTQYLTGAFGTRDPRAGATRMEFRILDQGGFAGGTRGSWSHVEVDPNNSFLQNLHTVPHEMFHQVQYRYNSTTSRSGIYGMVREGGARLIEDSINDQPNRWVATAVNIFSDPTQSMVDSPAVGTVVGASTPINYALGLFWKYMAEQHSTRVGAGFEPAIGIDAYRAGLEASATAAPGDPGVGYDPTTLRTARSVLPWYGRFDQFSYYDVAQTELNSHETTWGNYLIANYLHGTASPVGDSRFEYVEDDDAVTWPGTPAANLAALQATVLAGDSIVLARGSSFIRNVAGFNAWAARYYRITPSGTPGPRLLRVTFSAMAGMTDPLVQILLLGPGNTLVDIHRLDKVTYSKTINMDGLSAVIVIAASRANPGSFSLQLDEVASASDTMITRWNSSVGKEYEVDPRGWSWTWVSPDIMVDNDGDGLADSTVFFGMDNTLKVRLRNRGNQAVGNIQIDFWYQKATPFLTASGWIPLQDASGTTQQITGESLAASGDPSGDDVKWFSVNWAPVDDGTHHPHWCVKALVTVPGEPNTDNKLALSNFARVETSGDSDTFKLLARLPEGWMNAILQIVPHGPRWTIRKARLPKSSLRGRRPPRACEPAVEILMPSLAIMTDLTLVRQKLSEWNGQVRQPTPQPGRFYRVDPSTLPPGVDPETLVTVVQSVDGRLTGGITYEIIPKEL